MSEREDILTAIRDTGANVGDRQIVGGDITKAARKLGVSRRTLQARMRFYGIARGKAGRRKRKIRYTRAKKRYAVGAAALVLVGGALIYSRSKTST